MDKETLKALKESIEHWKRIYEKGINTGEGLGWENCSLCQLGDKKVREKIVYSICEECPVALKVKLNGCHKTPYYKVVFAFNEANEDDFKKYAKEELDFL